MRWELAQCILFEEIEMREAKITINDQELSEAQSRVVRVAIFAFLGEMSNPRVTEALGNVALEYQLRLTEVICMIDETPARKEA
jgi:hypothetical protein